MRNFKYISIIFFVLILVYLTSCTNYKRRLYALLYGTDNIQIKFSGYDSNNNNIKKIQNLNKGELVTKPNDPVMKGYTFVGWYIKEGNSKFRHFWNFETDIPIKSFTMYAEWKPKTINVTLNTDGGNETYENVSMIYDESYNLNNYKPTKENYVFLGWYDETGNKITSGTCEYTEDIILTAKWTKKYINVILDVNGGNETYENVSMIYDKSYNLNNYKPTKENYVFLGWYNEAGDKITSGICRYTEDIVLTAKWEDGTEGLQYKISEDKEYYILEKLTKTDKEYVIIPDTYNGLPIKEIAKYAFKDCKKLITVQMTDNIIKVGKEAFFNCAKLEDIYFSNNIEFLGEMALSNCSNLNYTTYQRCEYLGSKDNPYLILKRGIGYPITSITINENTKIIYEFALCGQDQLTSIVIPDSVIQLNQYAFEGCSNLINLTIGNGVIEIGYKAFSDCTNLTNVIIGNSVEHIGYSAFSDCTKLNNIVLGDSVKIIGSQAFSGCSSLTTITLGKNITSIYSYAFSRCENLTDIVLPSSLDYIGVGAFSDCAILRKIIIPKTVTIIGEYAFYNCNLIKIYCEIKNKPSTWKENWNPLNRPVVWGYTQD